MRWLTHPVAIALAATTFSIIFTKTSANAVFELRLKHFVNSYGRDIEGHCCSGFRDNQGRCTEGCNTKFRVCLKVYQDIIDPNSPCTFGEATTPILGENDVDFSKLAQDENSFENPVRFMLASWQVRLGSWVCVCVCVSLWWCFQVSAGKIVRKLCFFLNLHVESSVFGDFQGCSGGKKWCF
ncbi:Neurogenic locus protein delta [Portunus trituberculatus]|uniref:Neurogenic locus protein delta n=1 Tax=Portunus trituberculatus TaxID=210409 RepID=A0A5B7HDQ0_PORTR|nr:Neurogenic locus protein delta [Portunus trituberculatus]